MKCDVAVVGGGVIGLSIANELLKREPSSRVLVFEKEDSLGVHASGRNSGVIHSGFYYSPDTLKARFCKDGNIALKALCERYGIPIRNTGKIVVARNDADIEIMETLLVRGHKNNVILEYRESRDLPKYEPLARTYKHFLWSPTTAVTNPRMVIEALRQEFIDKGGILLLGKEIDAKPDGTIHWQNEQIHARHIVNCAGNQADRMAHIMNVGTEYSMIPFLGNYRSIPEEQLPLRTLVYPIPHTLNPFLGVHFTLTVDGKVKIGPSSMPVLGREQYSPQTSWNVRDASRIASSLTQFLLGNPNNFLKLIQSEIPKLNTQVLVRNASFMVPLATTIKRWKKMPPGIRSQLLHLPTRTLEQDFVVLPGEHSTHILNAVSPGWTSSIPFANWVTNEFILEKL